MVKVNIDQNKVKLIQSLEIWPTLYLTQPNLKVSPVKCWDELSSVNVLHVSFAFYEYS